MEKISYISVCLLFASCTMAEPDITFQYVDPLEKILPESVLFIPAEAQSDVARGENATFQFAFRCNQYVESIKVSLTPFRSEELDIEQKLDYKVSFVGNVHVGRSQATPASDLLMSHSRFYPDPLFDDEEIDVKANITQAVWISVPISTDFTPGTYEATVFVEGKSNGAIFKRTVSVRLKIYSTVIDKQTLLVTNWHQTGFSVVDGQEVHPFSERWWELMKQMAGLMKEYRQNVVLISPLTLAEYTYENGEVSTINFKKFDDVVNFFLKEGVLKKIAGGHIAGRFAGWESRFGYSLPVEEGGQTIFQKVDCHDAKAKAFYRKFFVELMTHLAEKGWKNIYIQHIADEPIKSNADTYISISNYVKSLCPELKLVDACHTKDLDNSIDVWIPQLNYLHRDFEFYQAQQQKGKEVWYYTCVWPQGEYANRFIQQPLIKTRLLHWINYKYNINGYLHWGLNFWRGNEPLIETASIQPDGLVLPAGDAWVVYPYKKHLVPSIRLEAMRDGIVDYELLRMLEVHNKDKAIQLSNKLIYDFNKYDIDITHFRAIRKELLEALELAK